MGGTTTSPSTQTNHRLDTSEGSRLVSFVRPHKLNPRRGKNDLKRSVVQSEGPELAVVTDPLTTPPAVMASRSMCRWSFQILENFLTTRAVQPPHTTLVDPPDDIRHLIDLNIRCPMFVTWQKRRNSTSHEGKTPFELRGCIGSLEPLPIEDLAKYAIRAAARDRRFHPISWEELPQLQCKVSLLSNFEKCATKFDWDTEIHGILINFTCNSVRYSATYLPGIAKEHKMTHEVAIQELIKKAGWGGSTKDHQILESLEVTRYISTKASLTFEEYARGKSTTATSSSSSSSD